MYAFSSSSISPSCSTLRARNAIATIVVVIVLSSGSYAQLSPNFYAKTCNEPQLFAAVSQAVKKAIDNEKRMGASLLRLHFHDCFIQGCDASILLDDMPGSPYKGEKTALINNNSSRGFDVIDAIKSEVESVCPGVVSCADVIAMAARDSVVQLGGPSWDVKLGRRDSLNASFSLANGTSVPSILSNITVLIESFKKFGLSPADMVALSGGHTIGKARCLTFRPRLYREGNINESFASNLKEICPSSPGNGDVNLAPFDLQTPEAFDNKYYGNLINQTGLLHTDQLLFGGGDKNVDELVKQYSQNQAQFFLDFAIAIVKMGDVGVLTGSAGEIRKNCRRPNK
ncbi:unnamed protein product [Cuscuta epithymum]|uniref:Peroxidase n=1 Tax=Cuscuta epithymum TaxID=186058 RepID=A0AAV0FSJ5_9ASTE|nr:unnamed protein product [Cuscuta epithymum]